MQKKLLTILLSIFMAITSFAVNVFANDLGDTPTLYDVLRTRPDFVFNDGNPEDGWNNSNFYKLFYSEGVEDGEYFLYLSYNYAYSNEIKIQSTETLTKDGSNYKITTDNGDFGGSETIDLLFVMDSNNVLDYIDVTTVESPLVAGKYGVTIGHISDNLQEYLELAWINDNDYCIYYDDDNSKLILQKDSSFIEQIPSTSLLKYSNNNDETYSYKYINGNKIITFNLDSKPSSSDKYFKDLTISGYDNDEINGTYTLLKDGRELWTDGGGWITADDDKVNKCRFDSNSDTFTLIEVSADSLSDDYYITEFVSAEDKEYPINKIEKDVFKILA